MNVETQRQGDSLVLITDGRVDGTNATDFQDAVKSAIQESDRSVVLDFEKLAYISSVGLRIVLLVAKDLRRQGAKFAACSLSASVLEVFVISGFDKIVPIHDSQAAAIGSFNS